MVKIVGRQYEGKILSDYWSIREVHYTGDVPEGMTNNEVGVGSDNDFNDFMGAFKHFITAVDKPILIYDDQKQKFIGEEPMTEGE